MQRGVGAHQIIAAVPVDRTPDLDAYLGRIAVDLVDQLAFDARQLRHPVFLVRDLEHAGVRRLATASGIEGGPVEDDAFGRGVDYPGVEYFQVAVDMAKYLCQFLTPDARNKTTLT